MIQDKLNLVRILLCVIFASALGERIDQQHRSTHHEKDYLHLRSKRYASGGRLPLSPYYTINDGLAVDKRYKLSPPASHFRELEFRQMKRPSPSLVDDSDLSLPQMQSYRNMLMYTGKYPASDKDIDLGVPDEQPGPISAGVSNMEALSDDELDTLLDLVDQYRGKASPPARNFYRPPAQYFTPAMKMSLPKRETGKRTGHYKGPLIMEQPMSFENSVASDSYPVFLTQKRSKRIGNMDLIPRSVARVKKETASNAQSNLDEFFAATGSMKSGQAENHTLKQSTMTPTTVISSNQIPSPSASLKQKKNVEWSNYFGIDKRQNSETLKAKPSEHVTKVTSSPVTGASKDIPTQTNKPVVNDLAKEVAVKSDNIATDPDKQWILKEFYKTLAMSTNVKRKRETLEPVNNNVSKLEKLEKKMEQAGDEIIWDALKYTGAHKDAQLSPTQLAEVKSQIIEKLAAAYSLEKVREALEEFRQQLQEKEQHY